jgi:tetratricopeptide (TPR) repeat protein
MDSIGELVVTQSEVDEYLKAAKKYRSRLLDIFTPERCDAEFTRYDDLAQDHGNWVQSIERSDWVSAARIALGLNDYFCARGLYREMENLWCRLIDNAPKGAPPEVKLALREQTGIAALNQNKLDVAEQRFNLVLDLARKQHNIRMEAGSLYQLGVLHLRQGRIRKAKRTLLEALQTSEHLEDKRVRQYIRGQLASVMIEEGKYQEAVHSLEEDLLNWKDIEHDADRVFSHLTLHTLGRAQLRQQRYIVAKDTLLQSLELKTQVGSGEISLARTECRLGEVCLHLGDYSSAEHYLRKSLPVLLRGGDLYYCAVVRMNYGILNFMRGCYHEANELFRQATADAMGLWIPEVQIGILPWKIRLALITLDPRDLPSSIMISLSAIIKSWKRRRSG